MARKPGSKTSESEFKNWTNKKCYNTLPQFVRRDYGGAKSKKDKIGIVLQRIMFAIDNKNIPTRYWTAIAEIADEYSALVLEGIKQRQSAVLQELKRRNG